MLLFGRDSVSAAVKLSVVLLCNLCSFALADVSITTPASDTTLSYCPDYFHNEWGVRLSMDDAASGALADIPDLQKNNTTAHTYTDGVLSFTSTGSAPLLTFLQYNVVGSLAIGSRYGQQHLINSSIYKHLNLRMYSSTATIAQVRWFHDSDRWAIATFPVYVGWNTYSWDLSSATIASSLGSNVAWSQGNPEGLELFPANASGVEIKIDWVQLTGSDCLSYSVAYNVSASGNDNLFSIVADDNTSASDGYVTKIVNAATAANSSASLPLEGLFPGTYNIYGFISGDWASLEYLNPFDMSDAQDVNTNLVAQLSSYGFASGKFSGVSSGTDSQFYLGIRNGKTIDASKYTYVSIGLDYTFPGLTASDTAQIFFFNSAGSLVGGKGFTVNSGSSVYQFQLTSGDGWSGNISNIRFDPTTISGTTFAVDFIAIREAGYVNSLSTPSLSQAPGTVTVHDIDLGILQPDKRGGADFAQNEIGNAWDMNRAKDIGPVYNVLSAFIYPHNTLIDENGVSHTGDFFFATNYPGNGDPANFFVLANGNIDTTKYVNVCYKGWNKTQLAGYNSVSRILWTDPRETDGAKAGRNGDDIVMTKSNQEYCVDMVDEMVLEPPLAAGSPNPWTSISADGYSVNFFRVDMNENDEGAASAYYSIIDYVTIRSDHQANTEYAIVIDAPLTLDVDLYYNTSKSTSGGTLIGSLSSGRNTNVLKWDTTAIPANTYYVYAQATKNGNTASRLAPGRLIINHSLTQDTTAPILVCERPDESYVFDSQLEVAGYALDETRLAALEVLVDNTYFATITPDRFHLAARSAYPTYAEANNPGFQKQFDATSLSYGAHVVKLVATDTAGNESSCEVNVTRQIGASTALLTYPDANGIPESVPINMITNETSPKMRIKVRKRKDVTITVTGVSGCEIVQVLGSSVKKFTDPVTLYTGIGESSIVLKVDRLRAFKPLAIQRSVQSNLDGRLYFRATCETGSLSKKNLIDLVKIKPTKPSPTSEAEVIEYIRTNLSKS